MSEDIAARYAEELNLKTHRLSALLSPFSPPEIERFESMPTGYRMRAEFRVWHEAQDSFYIMFEPGQSNKHFRVDQFPPAHPRINALMKGLRDAFMADDRLRQRLYQVEFLTTLNGEALITLIYRRPLDENWKSAATTLEQLLGARIIGRSRKQRIVVSEDYVTEVLSAGGRTLRYKQPEGSFVQPNGVINQSMLSWAISCCATAGGDLLELYCGLGNFSVALAPLFNKVLVTEINKTAIEAARHNLAHNGINNTFVARMSSAEVAQALSGHRLFNRLRGFDSDQFSQDTVLVDPPRAGLDPQTLDFVSDFKRIVYISCNPNSLTSNLKALHPVFELRRVALFDQFPLTPHIESGVLLERKK